MKKNLYLVAESITICLLCVVPLYALGGTGFHWGFDYTLEMEDNDLMPLSYGEFTSTGFLDDIQNMEDLESKLPITLQELKNSIEDSDELVSTLPLSLSRSEWTRSKINLGGKLFFDGIPVIDAVEFSFNIGAWEYLATLKCPNGQIQNNISDEDIDDFLETGDYGYLLGMNEIDLTLEQFGLPGFKFFGISKTPYVKFHFDISIRKNLIAKPDKLNTFQLYLGLGPTLNFSTPIITPSFVTDVIESSLDIAGTDFGKIVDLGENTTLMKGIIEKLIEESKNPTFGMHIIAGMMLKIPVIPVGFYFDSKFMIPFTEIDDNVELRGYGMLLNTGISLSL